jgi:hypothetical protein
MFTTSRLGEGKVLVMASGAEVIAAIRKKLTLDGKPPTEGAIAKHLGMHVAQLSAFKTEANLTPLKVANLVQRAVRVGEQRALSTPVKPVVEFYPVDAELNQRGGKLHELFEANVGGKPHPYRTGLKNQLQKSRGIYIFYDSRGCALYAGQAKSQPLWNEMKAAFNRDRQNLQLLRRVAHPNKKAVAFKPSGEKTRQIVQRAVPLSALAAYFSAYEVPADLIDDMEAFLIRAFPNDLLNKKMETFAKAAKRAASKNSTKI